MKVIEKTVPEQSVLDFRGVLGVVLFVVGWAVGNKYWNIEGKALE